MPVIFVVYLVYKLKIQGEDIKCIYKMVLPLNKFIFSTSKNSSQRDPFGVPEGPRRGSCLILSRGLIRSKFNFFLRGRRVVAGTKYSSIFGTVNTKSYYSTSCTPYIHPQFVTGVSDAESSFFITFIKSNKYSLPPRGGPSGYPEWGPFEGRLYYTAQFSIKFT